MADNIGIQIDNPELKMLRDNKTSGYNYRERRDIDFRENYELWRDKVQINRLTQRQSVHIPLMKQTMNTIMKDIDDMPVIEFQNLDNDKQAEIFKNEYWQYFLEDNRMELQDIIDKKQAILFGRTFDQMQVADGKVKDTIVDPQDILVSRYTNPHDINTSRFLIHVHIFKSLSEMERDETLDQKAVAEIRQWAGTEAGLIKSKTNEKMLTEKNQIMSDLGVEDVYSPILGEVIVECSQHFVWRKEDGDDEEQIYFYEECEDMKVLKKAKLESIVGTTKDHWFRYHYPYNTWAADIDKKDFWSDSVVDPIRTPNKVLDVWFSQLVENRTLRNYGMNFYDSTIEGFTPPSNQQPIPGGWYPLRGKPSEVYQHVEIPELSESLDEMAFIIQMAEKATGATATAQGVQTERKITLGEVELALGEAKERIKGLSKFYTQAWKDRGVMFDKLIEAAGDKIDAVQIHKKGKNTDKIYNRSISPKDWMAKSGYLVKVWSQDEKNAQDMKRLEKMNVAKSMMPDNPIVDQVNKRKVLEYADYTPEEINNAIEYEKKKQEQIMMLQQQQMNPPANDTILPTQPVTQPIVPSAPPLPVPVKKKMEGKRKETVKKLKSIRSKLQE